MLLALIFIIMAIVVLVAFNAMAFNTSWKNGYKGIVAIASSMLFFKFMWFCFSLAEQPDFISLNFKVLSWFM